MRVKAVLVLAAALGFRTVGAAKEAVVPVLINEYEVRGVTLVPTIEVEDAVYPYLGSDRDPEDVERARQAVEKLYQESGYKTVSVVIPEQEVKDGVVVLQVNEVPVGRLRVKGARYARPGNLKDKAPSLAEGKVINFNDITSDLVALNSNPDVQVTPALNPGLVPNTVDVNLEVKDRLPLHAEAELNNRAAPGTEPLRANVSLRATNLWDKGHTLSLSAQTSPQDTRQVKVFSGYYLARFEGVKSIGWMADASVQDSEVSTLGNANVVGRNSTLGVKALFDLPSTQNFFQTLSFGVTAKRARQQISTSVKDGKKVESDVVTYFPLGLSYSASFKQEKGMTELGADAVFHVRGLGSTAVDFEQKRYKADGSFVYVRGELSQTQELPWGFQLFGKGQGQLANQPLLSLEQFSGGGLGTVRGYLESEAVGDLGGVASIELRSPNLAFWDKGAKASEWRVYGFSEGGIFSILEALPEQKSKFYLASYGCGTRFRLWNTLTGSLDAGVPLYSTTESKQHTVRVTFRAGLEY